MTALLLNVFFNGFGIPQPLCTMVFDGRPPQAKGCDSHTIVPVQMGRRRDLPDLLQLSILRGRGEDHTGFFIIGFNHRSFEAFFSDISMRSDTAVFVKAFSFLRLLTGRGSSNGSAEIFHRRKRKSSFDEKRPFFGDFMRRACLSGRREFGAWEKLLAFQERKTRSHFFLRFSSRKHFSSSLRDYARR